MDEVGQADLGSRSGEADGADIEAHRSLLRKRCSQATALSFGVVG
jgi:predicted Rossmann fold nucleotide-binding protein DprA/Smf involved in DNA uptake